MFRPKLLFTSLAALALGACSPQDPQAVTSAAIAKQVILPTYSRWVEADRNLAASALAYCEGKESLDKARADFLEAQKAWAELQPLLVGPLAEGNRAWQVQFWPDKKNLVGRQVEQLVNGDNPVDAQSLNKASVVVRGLSAYEYILFDSKPDIASDEQKARYCPLLVAIGEHQKALAEEILKGWNSTDGMLSQMTKFPNQRYADSHEAIADLLRSQVTALDTLKKKLGAPMGRQSKGIAQPLQAEAGAATLRSRAWKPPSRRPRRCGSGSTTKACAVCCPAIRKPWHRRSTMPTPAHSSCWPTTRRRWASCWPTTPACRCSTSSTTASTSSTACTKATWPRR